MFWKGRNSIFAHVRSFASTTAIQQLVIGLLLALLTLSACQQSNPTSITQSQSNVPTPTSSQNKTGSSSSTTPTKSANHVSPKDFPLFVRITFTTTTTYDQAVSVIKAAGSSPYPWTCDNPHTPTPPSPAQQSTTFASSHTLLVSYPRDHALDQIAASSQVTSVDVAYLYMCP